MIIYLLRHLPTDLNNLGLLQGRLDHDLTDISTSSVSIFNNSKIFEESSISKVYISPLKRTLQTFEVYKEVLKEVEVSIDERITEFDFVEFENRHRSEMINKYGNIWNHGFTKIPFGEDIGKFNSRISSFLIDLSKEPHEKVLIISHGVVLRYMYCLLSGKDLDRINSIKFENNEVKVIDFK